MSVGYIPSVPDAIEDRDYLGIVVDAGQELGCRERMNATASYSAALSRAEDFARRTNEMHRLAGFPETARAVVLRRALRPGGSARFEAI